jgi:tellurite resistance protein TerC
LQWREASGIRNRMTTTLRTARRIVVAVVGGTITLLGIALLVLPGPAFVVIPIGLSILATEFVWARQWLHKVKDVASKAVGRKS